MTYQQNVAARAKHKPNSHEPPEFHVVLSRRYTERASKRYNSLNYTRKHVILRKHGFHRQNIGRHNKVPSAAQEQPSRMGRKDRVCEITIKMTDYMKNRLYSKHSLAQCRRPSFKKNLDDSSCENANGHYGSSQLTQILLRCLPSTQSR